MDDLRCRRIVDHLPDYALDKHPPVYEYPLPARVEEATLASLHPWIAKVASLTPAEAHAALESRWSVLADDALCRLGEGLLDCDVRSIVLTGDRAWLLCLHQNDRFHLIAPPLDRDLLKRQQARWGVAENTLLTDFLEQFGGLREDFAPCGGYFVDDQPWEGVDQAWLAKVNGYADWKNTPIIFSSRGGDLLVLHRTGRVGWWVSDEVRMRDAYDDLATCLSDFQRYRDVPWPFGSYRPPSGHLRVVG